MPSKEMPLSGVRVLDLTRYEAGPTCTLMLAFLGAEVIKIESPGEGKSHRRMFHDRGDRDDLYFVLLNLNKKSVTLELKSENGRSLFERMLQHADVLVESLGGEKLSELNLSYDRLRQCNPGIVIATVSGYGSYGACAGYPSLDMTAQAMGGIMSLTGREGKEPLRCGATVADSAGGTNLAIGVLSALYRKVKTGKGAHVEVSLQDSAINLGRSLLGTHIAYGSKAPRVGNSLKDVVPWDIYPSRDGYVAICVIPQRRFERLMGVVGGETALEEKSLNTIEDRVRERKFLDALITRWTTERGKFEIMERLAKEGVPCGAVLDSDEIALNSHVRERSMLVEIEHPQWGRVQVMGCPVKFLDEEAGIACSPDFGEHTREILGGLLGLSDEDMDELRRQGVI
ncbi:MAG: CoA transferase [Deltaproteobacteria bacterium]|nr:CoA transferase [Deltaproteobacteria bacterium]